MVIDKNTLIVDQALKIVRLEYSLEKKDVALRHIQGILVCIGGPLNDNLLRFSNDQLMMFREIQEYINGAY